MGVPPYVSLIELVGEDRNYKWQNEKGNFTPEVPKVDKSEEKELVPKIEIIAYFANVNNCIIFKNVLCDKSLIRTRNHHTSRDDSNYQDELSMQIPGA